MEGSDLGQARELSTVNVEKEKKCGPGGIR